MKRIVLALALIAAISSCKSKKESANEIMVSAVKQNLNDEAFKNNSKVKILNCDLIRVDSINENIYDTVIVRNIILNKAEIFIDKMKPILANMRTERKWRDLQMMAGNNDVAKMNQSNLDEMSNEVKGYNDSLHKYTKMDSGLTAKAKLRINPESIFESIFYIKATAITNGRTENLLDTFKFYFSNNLQLIPMNEF